MAGVDHKTPSEKKELLRHGSDEMELYMSICSKAESEDFCELKETVEANPNIIAKICAQGMSSVMRNILQIPDLDVKKFGQACLREACINGHSDIVQLFLNKGIGVCPDVFKDDSEFYLATLHGQTAVVDVLYERFPEFLCEEELRYCLAYAACKGGHLNLVHKWLNGSMDVNLPVQYVSDLKDCEKKFPLFAACSGGYLDIAEFLICDMQAELTELVCHSFPDFTLEIIQSFFKKKDHCGNEEYLMSNMNLTTVLPLWFGNEAEQSDDLETADGDIEIFEDIPTKSIDLSENRLRTIPADILWHMAQLSSLNLSYNPLATIPHPPKPEHITADSLIRLDLSHCELTCISEYIFSLPQLEELDLSYNHLEKLDDEEQDTVYDGRQWKCKFLQTLNVSNNALTFIPSGISGCKAMVHLKANKNKLVYLCSPWQCCLKTLDLSDNSLKIFPSNADQFWKTTLANLNLRSNRLDEVAESIVRMGSLKWLDVSHNRIRKLPEVSVWACPLEHLNLSHNYLGDPDKSKSPLQKTLSIKPSRISFTIPSAKLKETLLELELANNKLKSIPLCICDLSNLSTLDLSHNSSVTALPEDLGKLRKLLVIRLEGIQVTDKVLQEQINKLADPHSKEVYAYDIVKYLEKKRRQCCYPDVLKMVVLGCKNADGHCTVKKLLKSKDRVENHQEMRISPWKVYLKSFKRTVSVHIWELPALANTAAVLPCFLTLNSLYVLVHDVMAADVKSCLAEFQQVADTLSLIQACVNRPACIILCTYSYNIVDTLREEIEKAIAEKVKKEFKCVLHLVSISRNQKLDSLQTSIQEAIEEMYDASFEKKSKLIERQVPASFVEMLTSIQEHFAGANHCILSDFLEKTECNLDDSVDRNLKLHEFLLQSGAMLHYNNSFGDLSKFVILNPCWLFDILVFFLESFSKGRSRNAQVLVSQVHNILQDKLPTDEVFQVFLYLLEAFSIAVRISDNKRDNLLLIPSLLPDRPPEVQLEYGPNSHRVCRLYQLPTVPRSFWSQAIAQLLAAFDRLSSSNWKLSDSPRVGHSRVDKLKSFRMTTRMSSRGLRLNQKNIQYWQSGILMIHDQGYVVVEQVECENKNREGEAGILITVQTSGSQRDSNSLLDLEENILKRLAVIGIVKDNIEELVEMFHPKYCDPFSLGCRSYALCPVCCPVKPCSETLNVTNLHFTVAKCAQMVLSYEVIMCPKGPTALRLIVPEMFFFELPPNLHIQFKDIEMIDETLGQGLVGTVRKGKWNGRDVAIKSFFILTNVQAPLIEDEDEIYSNVETLNASITRRQQDNNEADQLKILCAFSDVRQEVGILSKLNHPCIISMLGVCIKPQLFILLELAPLGSLRSQIDLVKGTNELPSADTWDKSVTSSIFSKDLTYKMSLQIASALAYLHKNNIIYRDLKPGNILVMSLNECAPVNVKISDYGISKFVTLQALTGISGTVGYMAPEVMAKLPYSCQIDVYSYSIVLCEILTGIPPLGKDQRSAVSQMSITESTPQHLKGLTLHTHFPCVEDLMSKCWALEANQRPTTRSIEKLMKREDFLLQHDVIWMEDNSPVLTITHIYTCEMQGRWSVWICESSDRGSRYLSVYDIESSCFTVVRQESTGPAVIAMAKSGNKIFLACQDSKALEVIVRGNQQRFELQTGHWRLDGVPTCLYNVSAEESPQDLLIIGLKTGSIVLHNVIHKKSEVRIRPFEVEPNTPVTSICCINNQTLAIALGTKICFYKDENSQNLASSSMPDLVLISYICFLESMQYDISVDFLTSNGHNLWCGSKCSNNLFQVHVKDDFKVKVINLEWDSDRDIITVQEKQDQKFFKSPIRRAGTLQPQKESSSDKDDEPVLRYGTFPRTQESSSNCSPSSISRESLLSEAQDQVGPLQCPSDLLSTRPKAFGANHPEKTVTSPPTVPPRRTRFSTENQRGPSQATWSTPPPIPRRSESNINLAISSLLVSEDVLIVGTDVGAMLFLPILTESDILAKGPTQCSAVRHPERVTEWSAVKHEAQQHIDVLKGTITSLHLADKNVVSLHVPTKEVQLRKRLNSKSSVKSERGKRNASCFDSSSLEIFELEFSGSQGLLSVQDIDVDIEEPVQAPHQIADLVVWDPVSSERLETIKSYWQVLEQWRFSSRM